LRLILNKTHTPLRGGFAPITQTVAFTTFGGTTNPAQWVNMNGSFNIPSITNPLQSMQFLPTLLIKPITYLVTEQVIMDSPNVAVDVIEQRITSSIAEIFDTLNATILGTAGTNTLQMYGLQDIIDNGTNQTYWGGLSRATYAALNSQIYANALTGVSAYQVIHRYLMSFLNDVNQRLPDIGITSYAVFDALTESLTSIERVNISDPAGTPATSRDWVVQQVSIDGVPIMPDPNITTNTIYFLNLDKLSFGTVPQLNFKLTEPESLVPVGQLGYVQVATVSGQFYSFEPNAHFALTSAPSNTLY
jgi:hypothetical protein